MSRQSDHSDMIKGDETNAGDVEEGDSVKITERIISVQNDAFLSKIWGKWIGLIWLKCLC